MSETKPVSPLRQRMIEDMAARKLMRAIQVPASRPETQTSASGRPHHASVEPCRN